MKYLEKVMSDKEGRAFINELIGFCGVFQASTGEFQDIMRQEGKRQVGLFLMSKVQETDPKNFYKMLDEFYSKNKEKDHERERANTDKQREYDNGNDFDYRHFSDSSGRDSSESNGVLESIYGASDSAGDLGL